MKLLGQSAGGQFLIAFVQQSGGNGGWTKPVLDELADPSSRSILKEGNQFDCRILAHIWKRENRENDVKIPVLKYQKEDSRYNRICIVSMPDKKKISMFNNNNLSVEEIFRNEIVKKLGKNQVTL